MTFDGFVEMMHSDFAGYFILVGTVDNRCRAAIDFWQTSASGQRANFTHKPNHKTMK